MSEITGPTHCCLATIAKILACLTRCAMSAQEVLNTVWYRFALYTLYFRKLADGQITPLVSSMTSLNLDITLGEEE